MRLVLLAATTTLVVSTAFSGASAQPAGEGYDFDTLAACSIVYGRISEIYAERGEDGQARSFRDTSHAYSASAFHTLRYTTDDESGAYEYAEDRMQQVTSSLNDSSGANPEGDMGVVTEWLPYCDSLGAGVTEILARREATGW